MMSFSLEISQWCLYRSFQTAIPFTIRMIIAAAQPLDCSYRQQEGMYPQSPPPPPFASIRWKTEVTWLQFLPNLLIWQNTSEVTFDSKKKKKVYGFTSTYKVLSKTCQEKRPEGWHCSPLLNRPVPSWLPCWLWLLTDPEGRLRSLLICILVPGLKFRVLKLNVQYNNQATGIFRLATISVMTGFLCYFLTKRLLLRSWLPSMTVVWMSLLRWYYGQNKMTYDVGCRQH